MLRIADLKSEIANQLGVLEEQAKKAAEFTELKGKLKVLEVGLAKRQIRSLNEKKKTVEERINTLRGQMELGLDLTRQHEERRVAKKEELRSVDFEMETARLNMSQAKLSYEENKSLILLEKEKKHNLEERITEAESRLNELSMRLEMLTAKRREMEASYVSAGGSRSSLEKNLSRSEAALSGIEQGLTGLEGELDVLKSEILDNESSLSSLRNERVELESNLRLAGEETKHDEALIAKLGAEKVELEKRSGSLRSELGRIESILKNKSEQEVGFPEVIEDLNVTFSRGHGLAGALGAGMNVGIEIAYGGEVRINKVSLNDDVIFTDGVLSGGSLRDKIKGMLRKERELSVLIEEAKNKHDLEASSL
jgi:chromosome segregation ATPase